MEYICTLPKDINHCKYFSDDQKHCLENNTQCGFIEIRSQEFEPKKQSKWYEKYYK